LENEECERYHYAIQGIETDVEIVPSALKHSLSCHGLQEDIYGESHIEVKNMITRPTNEEFEILSDDHVANPPELSGQPGYLTQLWQRALVNELLDPNYARIVNAKASALSVSPSEVIQDALKVQLAG